LFKIILLRSTENLLSSISGLGGVAAVLDFMGGVGAEHRKGAILARPGQAELGPAMASERGAGGRPSQDEIRSFLNPYVRYFFFAYLVLDYFINLRPMHRVTDLVYFCFKMI